MGEIMRGPNHDFITIGEHDIHVSQWGEPTQPAVILWHGLSRNGRDFDELALSLSEQWWVLCPDTLGRGLSSWSSDPARDYSLNGLVDGALALLKAYGIKKAGWIGTSMGGLIAMMIAARYPNPLSWIVLNDIGPVIPDAAIERIVRSAGAIPTFSSVRDAEAAMREAYAPFGPASDQFWRRIAMTSIRRRADGTFTTHFDPRILVDAQANIGTFDLWDAFQQIQIPVHVIGGADSDVLVPDIAEQMRQRGPKPSVTLLEHCGHAPSLSRSQDAALVKEVIAKLQSASQTPARPLGT